MEEIRQHKWKKSNDHLELFWKNPYEPQEVITKPNYCINRQEARIFPILKV